jgi:hypothetical protein
MSLTLIFAILYTNILENNFGNNLAKEKIQKKIFEQEEIFDQYSGRFFGRIKQQDTNFVFSGTDIQSLRRNHINFYFYKKSKLISWSDNEAIPNAGNFIINNELYLSQLTDGYYIVKSYREGDYHLIATFLIAHNYPFENEYLNNDLNPVFELSKSVELHFENSNKKDDYTITNKEQKVLFKISFPKTQITGPKQSIILFIIYMLLLAFSLNFLYILLRRRFKKQRLFFIYAALVLLIRIVLQYLRMPDVLFETDIFNPSSYAASHLVPSLGDLFLSIYSIFVIVLAGNNLSIKEWRDSTKIKFNKTHAVIFGTLIILTTIILFHSGINVIHNLIINSSIHLDIADFFELNHLSFIGLLVIAQLIFILLFLLYALVNLYNQLLPEPKLNYILALSVLTLGSVFFITDMPYRSILFMLLIMLMIFSSRGGKRFTLQKIIPVFLLISLITAISMNEFNHEAEQLRRKAIVRSVAINQDPQVEYLFRKIEKEIYEDTTLIQAFHNNDVSFDSITNYIFKTYFAPESHWKKYDLQATI